MRMPGQVVLDARPIALAPALLLIAAQEHRQAGCAGNVGRQRGHRAGARGMRAVRGRRCVHGASRQGWLPQYRRTRRPSTARILRLDNLSRGFTREHSIMATGDDPLLYLERQD
jgi:hypothetical protein